MTSRLSNAEISSSSPLSDINDKRLLQILQQQNVSLEQTQAQIKQVVDKDLVRHIEITSSQQLGIDDPTIEAGYNPKTGKIFIVADNIRASNALTRELINIASVYGRSNAQIQRGLENDLLYWNKEKGAKFLDNFSLQLRSSLSDTGSVKGAKFLDNLTLQLRSPLSENSSTARNIKTEADLSQYQNDQLKFSRTAPLSQGGNTSVLELSRGGNINVEPKWFNIFTSRQEFKEAVGKGLFCHKKSAPESVALPPTFKVQINVRSRLMCYLFNFAL